MYSNLYKSSWVVIHDDEARIIDNNQRIEEKLKGVVLHAASIAGQEGGSMEEDGFLNGIDAQAVDAFLESGGSVAKGDMEQAKEALLKEIEEAKEELAAVRAQADQMIEDAKSEIGAMQMKAYEEAKNQGYEEGSRKGLAETEEAKQEYLSMQKRLEQEYQNKIEELEPEFIDTLTGIYEHIFKVDLSGYKGLVTSLLTGAMQKMDECRSFLVHVSKEDYENVMENKERILSETGKGKASVEFTEDLTLPPSQCYIETENGIYDCGLDTQLKELKKKLMLLSYEK